MALPIELTWHTSFSMSSMHAVAVLLGRQPLANAELTAEMYPIVKELRSRLMHDKLDERPFLAHLVPQSGEHESDRHLAEVTLLKVLGRERMHGVQGQYQGLITQFEQAFARHLEPLDEPSITAASPLRERWVAEGNRFWAALGTYCESSFLPSSAKVFLVHPVCGGGGAPHIWYLSCRIEAIFGDTVPELPEVLRLGWLLAQLNLRQARYREDLRLARTNQVGALAALAAVLAAGEETGWSTFSDEQVRLALEVWQPECEDLDFTTAQLTQWWRIYTDQRPPWGMSLVALNKMLGWPMA